MSVIFFIYILAALFSSFVFGCLLGAIFSKPFRQILIEVLTGRRDLFLARTLGNPILAPGEEPWAAEAVLNPAAVDLGGRVHLLYRAIGMDGVSRLGYASSPNGIVFDERLPYPAFVASKPSSVPGALRRYSPVMYPSGGSWGGCEDPRMVTIDGRVYVTYNAFDDWDNMRVAFISMPELDFFEHRFGRWSAPKLLSRPGERHKNWVLFPQKFKGKFAVLHSINPTIEVAYVDDLDAVGDTAPFIKSLEAHRGDMQSGSDGWDYIIRSAGPPPVKTSAGWLVLYHAHSKGETHKYKLGAMLLDLENPTKIIARACAPVLTPDASYENHGKPGIVYACGAIVRGDILYVYYGGADKVVCVATAALSPFLEALVKGELTELAPAPALTR